MKAKLGNKGPSSVSQDEKTGASVNAALTACHCDTRVIAFHDPEVASLKCPVEKDHHEFLPWQVGTFAALKEHQDRIDLKLRELVMSSPQIELVEGEALCINLAPVGATVAVRAEGNKVFVIVRSNLFPRDDVVNVYFDLATSGDGAAVPSFDENAPF
jgi:hypothetical protein